MSTTDKRLPEYILPNLAEIISGVEGDILFQLSLRSRRRGHRHRMPGLGYPTQEHDPPGSVA